MNNNFDVYDDIIEQETTLSQDDLLIIDEELKSENQKYQGKDFKTILFDFLRSSYKKLIILILIFVLFINLVKILLNLSNKYRKLETEVINYARDYTWMETIEIDNKKEAKILIDDLKRVYLIRKNSEVNKCNGYVIVKNKNYKYHYKTYLKCDNYVTKGYEGID